MKSLTNFEAFKLNKNQMNEITGSGIFCSGRNGQTAHFEKTSLADAQAAVDAIWIGGGVCEVEI